jgi:hypothetical protein
MPYLSEDLSEEPEGTLRLLLVHPGASDLIRCSLGIALLRDPPKDQALSYTWGTGNADRPILIDGQVFIVRQNLWALLKRLQVDDGKTFVV